MKITIDNLVTEYADDGQGPVILMLHGWWRNLRDFDGIVDRLKNEYRIIRFDLPGFGGTEMPRNNWGVSDYSKFTENFIQKLGIKPEIFLGHSSGGRIILRGVGTGVLEAKKTILISAAGLKTNGWRRNIFLLMAKIGDFVSYIPPFLFIKDKIKTKFYELLGSEYLDSGKMKEIFKIVVNEDLSKFASKISIPTLLVWGEDDAVTPISQAKILHNIIKNSRLEIIKNSGHFSFVEKPDETINIIKKFI